MATSKPSSVSSQRRPKANGHDRRRMSLREHLRPLSGTYLRHVATGRTRSVLDDTYIGVVADNRWNEVGTPTYYFALDRGILVAEYGRHIESDLPDGEPERLERSLYKVEVSLEVVLDLTDPETVAAFGAATINDWILELATTQKTATYLLAQLPELQGLVVPSVAFLDHHERYNVVIFGDRIDSRSTFGMPAHLGDLVIEGVGKDPA